MFIGERSLPLGLVGSARQASGEPPGARNNVNIVKQLGVFRLGVPVVTPVKNHENNIGQTTDTPRPVVTPAKDHENNIGQTTDTPREDGTDSEAA